MTTPFGKFFLPGPTEVLPEVAKAQEQPMIGHRGAKTEALLGRLDEPLKAAFRTKQPVYIAASSATGLMEAAIRNGVREKVLCLINGSFSERFAKIATACGKEVVKANVPLGQAFEADAVKGLLESSGADAVTLCHSETSTGVLNPIADIAKVVLAKPDVMYLVDAVTSLGGSPVETDAWGLDFVLTGSQKAFALPPGLAFGVASPRLLERAKSCPIAASIWISSPTTRPSASGRRRTRRRSRSCTRSRRSCAGSRPTAGSRSGGRGTTRCASGSSAGSRRRPALRSGSPICRAKGGAPGRSRASSWRRAGRRWAAPSPRRWTRSSATPSARATGT